MTLRYRQIDRAARALGVTVCDVRHCRRIRGGVNPAVNQTDCRNVACPR